MKMGKKFKEYRMFWVCLVIFIVFIGMSIYFGVQGHIAQLIGTCLLSLIALFLLLLRYKMVLFDDMMMIYEWKVAAMLPTMIEYKDIQSMERKSKHHLIITHKHVSHVYVFNTDQFISTYQSIKK